MPYTRTFNEYRPGERDDDQPWIGAYIREAPDDEGEPGTWTTIDTIEFDTPDADPADPGLRDLTTDAATLTEGWYQVVFYDADGVEQETDPVAYPPAVALRPTIGEVAALERARTYVSGVEVGTFNTSTRPTEDEVSELIDMAVADVEARVGTIPDGLAEEGRRLAALQAATLIEASYFPEQLDTDRSAYRQYQAMYLSGIDALKARVGGATGGGSVGSFALSTSVSVASDELTDEADGYYAGWDEPDPCWP